MARPSATAVARRPFFSSEVARQQAADLGVVVDDQDVVGVPGNASATGPGPQIEPDKDHIMKPTTTFAAVVRAMDNERDHAVIALLPLRLPETPAS
jgi:hypothetical protein